MGAGHVLAVIGGSGLYEIDGLSKVEEVAVDTPFGPPSDVIVRGTLAGPSGETTLLFLPRHGRGHRIPPHSINYRANICALKMTGATHLVTVSAVGSMKEGIAPGDLVAADQFIDLTKRRVSTFFDDEVAAHVAFANPVCAELHAALASSAGKALQDVARGPGASARKVHGKGTYVCIEGPQFSSRAESLLYRSWGVDVIGMTAMPEAKLAREAELPYAVLALATDYDCWHEGEADVSVQAVVATMKANVESARKTIAHVAHALPDPKKSNAASALEHAVMTSPDRISKAARARLGWLVNRYLPA